MLNDSDVILSDMSLCQPPDALSAKREQGRWQMIEYVTDRDRGVMLSAGPETKAPEVKLPLGAEGWHAIHVACRGSGWQGQTTLRIKLTDDPCFSSISSDVSDFHLDEGYWKCADLTGQDLVIAQQTSGHVRPATIASVRLVPMSAARARYLLTQRHSTAEKRLIAMNDGFSFLWERRPVTADEIREEVEPYRDTDFQKLLWCVGAGGDVVTYPSKVADLIGQDTTDYPRDGDRFVAQAIRGLVDKGIDPLKVALEHAREIGIEFHVSQRMGAFAMCPPWEEFFTGRFFREHPEFRCVDRDGTQVARLSYAFAEVRGLMLQILREVAGYGIDGVNLIFVRGVPYVLYEKPLIQGFRKKFGRSPREVHERDGRWLAFRAEVMTDFMREVRAAMDAVSEEQGNGRLQVSAVVLENKEHNLYYGLDVETWAREGLVDVLIPYGWQGEIDTDFFGRITHGSPCKLYPNVMPRRMSPAEYRRKALAFYEKGADGLCFWDTDQRHTLLRQWSLVRRLGHTEELREKAKAQAPDPEPIPLRKLGGYALDRYPPHWAY